MAWTIRRPRTSRSAPCFSEACLACRPMPQTDGGAVTEHLRRLQDLLHGRHWDGRRLDARDGRHSVMFQGWRRLLPPRHAQHRHRRYARCGNSRRVLPCPRRKMLLLLMWRGGGVLTSEGEGGSLCAVLLRSCHARMRGSGRSLRSAMMTTTNHLPKCAGLHTPLPLQPRCLPRFAARTLPPATTAFWR